MSKVLNHAAWGVLIILVLGLSVFNVSQAGVTEVDLSTAVGIWLFDEGSGDSTKDMSSEGNHGELVKSPKWVTGKFGKALEFNGKDNFVKTGQKLLDARAEFTVLCWVKPGKLTANRIGLLGQNDSPEFGFINPTTVNLWTPCSSVEAKYEFPAGEWHHIAVVSTGVSLTMYFDGQQKAQTEKDCSKDTHGSSDFGVNIGGGGVWDATGNWFTGAMDEVAIFHSALSNADVNKIMKTGFKAMTTAVDPRNRLTSTWAQIRKE